MSGNQTLFNGNPGEWISAKQKIIERVRAVNGMKILSEEEPLFLSAEFPPEPVPPTVTKADESSGAKTRKSKSVDADSEKEYIDYLTKLEVYQKQYHMRLKIMDSWNIPKAAVFKVLLESVGTYPKSVCQASFKSGDPKKIWNDLENRFGSNPKAEVSDIFTLLSNMTLGKSETIVEYLTKQEQYFESLKERSYDLADPIRLSMMTSGIEKSVRCADYKEVLQTCRLNSLNFEDTKNFLINEELRNSSSSANSSKSKINVIAQAENTQGKGKNNRKYDNTKNITCYGCGKEGHIKSKCPDKKEQATTAVSSIVCDFCDKKGHSVKECRFLMSYKKTRNSKESKDGKEAQEIKQCEVISNEVCYECNIMESNINNVEIGLDSLASCHITGNKKLLENIRVGEEISIRAYDGTIKNYNQIGEMRPFGVARYIPESNSNILSVGQLVNDGFDVEYDKTEDSFIVRGNELQDLSFVRNERNTYTTNYSQLSGDINEVCSNQVIETKEMKDRLDLAQELHERLGHPSKDVLIKLLNNGGLLNTSVTTRDVELLSDLRPKCAGCIKGKFTHQVAKPTNNPRSEKVGELLHIDIYYWNDCQYLISLDDHSNHVVLIYLETKSKWNVIKAIDLIVGKYRSHGHIVSSIRTDSESVFLSIEDDMNHKGIVMQVTAPENHERSVERAARTIGEKARSIIYSLSYDLPSKLYNHALEYAVRCHNLLPSKVITTTPNQIVIGKRIDFNVDLRAKFGDIGLFRKPYANKNKLSPRAELGIVVGIVPNSNGVLKVFLPEKNKIVRRFKYEKQDKNELFVSYLENHYELKGNIVEDDEISISDDNDLYWNDPEQEGEIDVMESQVASVDGPVKVELQQLLDEKVFIGVLPNETNREELAKIIPCSEFTIVKYKPDGSVDKVKSRVVAGGHKQMQDETVDNSSPTIDLTSFWTLLSLASYQKFKCMTIDVKGAYLKVEIENRQQLMKINKRLTNLVIELDSSFKKYQNPKDGSMIVKLQKALYGLRESSKLWYEDLKSKLIKYGLTESKLDRCLFMKDASGNKGLYVTIHVDDLFVASDDQNELIKFSKYLKDQYNEIKVGMSTDGSLSYLGMTITVNDVSGEIKISQQGYIDKLLARYNVTETAKTPSTDNLFEIDESQEHVDKTDYISRVMSLMYLAKRTRPDILKEVCILSTFNQNPTSFELSKINRVLKYINYTKHRVLTINVTDLQVNVYADASYAVHTNGRSHSGGIIMCGTNGGVIYARSNKQKLVSLSSTEAEIIAVNDILMRGIQIQSLLVEMGVKSTNIILFQDNLSTINLLTKSSKNSFKSKHINVRFFFTRDLIKEGRLRIQHCPTEDMKADILTKPLIGYKFTQMVNWLLNNAGT
jgi:hypothetical protein